MEQQAKKILLLGGTGAMGVYLAPALRKAGYEVYITSRQEHGSNESGIHYIKGNAKDISFLHQLLEENYDAIVDFMVYHTEQFAERYELLLNSTNHYLFLSSYRVYGDNGTAPITEQYQRLLDSVQDPAYLATDEYGLTKARQENLLLNSSYKNWTILRPAITYSKTRFQLGTMEANEFLCRILNKKTIVFPKEMLEKEATLSWAGDVANMIERLIFKENAMGEIFTLSTAEHHTWEEVLQLYVEILGARVKLIDLSEYKDIIGRPWQIKYDRMFHRIVDNRKVLEVTGMRQEELMPLKQGLQMELEHFVENPSFAKIDSVMQKKMDQAIEGKTAVKKSKLSNYISKLKILFSGELTMRQKMDKILNHWRVRCLLQKMKNK